MPGPARLVVSLLLVAGLLAGCGGSGVSEANRYVDAVNRAQNRFAATIDRLSTSITPTSTAAQDTRTLHDFDTALGQVIADLRAVKPPDRVRSLHARLIGEIAGFRSEVARAGAALHSRDAAEVLSAQSRLTKATTQVSGQINQTIAQINRKLRK